VDRRRDPLPTRVDDLRELPSAYDAALDAGLASLGLPLDATARRALSDHARLLLAWNRAINLTSITDPERLAVLHVLDSLSAAPLLLRAGAMRLADLGSGGGYPGLPLAVALPETRVTLIDSIAKKTRFLEAAVHATGLSSRVEVATARAEALENEIRKGRRRPFDVVTARAVGAMGRLVELAFPLLARGGRLIAWKRGDVAAEVEAAATVVQRLGGGSIRIENIPTPGLEGHVLVVAERR
jgi:16S rRNA (guanine527-N7)-methyltransferase